MVMSVILLMGQLLLAFSMKIIFLERLIVKQDLMKFLYKFIIRVVQVVRAHYQVVRAHYQVVQVQVLYQVVQVLYQVVQVFQVVHQLQQFLLDFLYL